MTPPPGGVVGAHGGPRGRVAALELEARQAPAEASGERDLAAAGGAARRGAASASAELDGAVGAPAVEGDPEAVTGASTSSTRGASSA